MVDKSVRVGRREGIAAYEKADNPCFDDGQVGGEDREPRHEGRRGRRGSMLIGAAEMLPSLLHGSCQILAGLLSDSSKRRMSWSDCECQLAIGKHSALNVSVRRRNQAS